MSSNRRAADFLTSAPNLAGCLLAMGGLGLYFGGVIHLYWWAIVGGLYGAGALGWPRKKAAPTMQYEELPAGMLAQQVGKLVDNSAKGIPAEALEHLRAIETTLAELLPRLQKLQDRGVISPKDCFTVVETIRRYLPDTLGAYMRLPRLYAQTQAVVGQQTAAQLLTSQLMMLNGSLREISRNAFSGDAEKLVTNGKFLEARFSEGTVFRPQG